MIANPRIYSDANPIIEFAKWAKKTHDPLREPDMLMMQKLLQAANNEDISLFTSSISVAECVAAGDDWSIDVQEFFIGVLGSGRMFKLVQDTIFVAEQARDLRWKHNIKLSGMDAIHVASAIEAQCTEFLTWDRGINKIKSQLKAKFLASQGIAAITPSMTKLLPPSYLSYKSTLFSS
jgi:predicted nucleic acid-binding protein